MTITLNGTTGIVGPNGTASAPAMTGTDTDTGIVYGTNTVQIATGGTTAVTVDSSQNVGIGTTSPVTLKSATTLQVNGNLKLGNANDRGLISLGDTSSTGANAGIWRGAAGAYGSAGNYLCLGGYDGITFTTGNADIASQTERMRIDSSGNLLVGKSASSATTVGFQALANGEVYSACSASTSASNSYILYSTGAAAFRFYVGLNGQINATSTSITAISDISLKENVRDLETGLAEIVALKPRRFDWKEETKIGEKNVAGFIAQELEEVLPELVYEYQYNSDETKKSIKMGDILPTLVKAIQELKAQLDESNLILTSVKTELDTVKTELATLKGTA